MPLKFILYSFLCLFCCQNAHAINDSTIVFKPRYTKQEYKKEVKDLKEFDKVYKSFKKAAESTNIDLKNSTLESLKTQMKKEYDELNARITSRAKKFSPMKKPLDSIAQNDLPKGYNPTIKGQIQTVDKTALIDGKSETEILIRYSKILNKENRLIKQLSMMEEITESTPNSSISEILNNGADFKSYLKEELNLMNKEKGKPGKKSSN